MSTVKYYPNWPNTVPVYDIGTEGLEHSRSGISGFVADIIHALYPVREKLFDPPSRFSHEACNCRMSNRGRL
jgi:hypothetical protein